jgi:hypothetical protein
LDLLAVEELHDQQTEMDTTVLRVVTAHLELIYTLMEVVVAQAGVLVVVNVSLELLEQAEVDQLVQVQHHLLIDQTLLEVSQVQIFLDRPQDITTP